MPVTPKLFILVLSTNNIYTMKFNQETDAVDYFGRTFLFNNGIAIISKGDVYPFDIAEGYEFEMKNTNCDHTDPYIEESDFFGETVIVPINDDFEFSDTQLIGYATSLIERAKRGEVIDGVMLLQPSKS